MFGPPESAPQMHAMLRSGVDSTLLDEPAVVDRLGLCLNRFVCLHNTLTSNPFDALVSRVPVRAANLAPKWGADGEDSLTPHTGAIRQATVLLSEAAQGTSTRIIS